MADRFLRYPEQDKRKQLGDGFDGDAWQNTETGEIFWVAVGHVPYPERRNVAKEKTQ